MARPVRFPVCCAITLLCCLTLCALVTLATTENVAAATDGERILLFESTVDVARDGTLTVQERLRVVALGKSIRYGIYRDIPITYKGNDPFTSSVPLTVLGATLDGKALRTDDIERGDGNVRIYLRREDRLTPGEHEFVLTYSTGKHIRFFPDHDELAWNATGYRWAFPIEKSVCTIRLPEEASGQQLRAWLGRPGSQTQPVHIQYSTPHTAVFQSQRTIMPGEEMTVAMAWNPGVITPETRNEEKLVLFRVSLYGIFGLTLILCCALWLRFGRDPKAGVIIPRFYPPKDPHKPTQTISAAALDYIISVHNLTPRGLAALFLGLLAHKRLHLSTATADTYILEAAPHNASGLTAEEKAVMQEVCKQALPLSDSKRLSSLIATVRTKLGTAYGSLWSKNTHWIIVMYLVYLAAVFIVMWSFFTLDDAQLYTIYVAIPCFFLWFLGERLEHACIEWRREGWKILLLFGCFILCAEAGLIFAIMGAWEPPSETGYIFGFLGTWERETLIAVCCAIILLIWLKKSSPRISSLWRICLLPFYLSCILTVLALCMDLLTDMLPVQDCIVPLLAGCFLPSLFQAHMKAPSVACRAMLDEIEGFAMYISATEKDRLNMLNPPERTPEEFERILPYAVALGQEQAWGAQFAGILDNHDTASDGYTAWWSSGVCGSMTTSCTAGMAYSKGSSGGGSVFSSGGGGAGSGGGGGGGGGC